MRKSLTFFCFIFFWFFLSSICVYCEEVTLLTYYPSPRAVYKELWIYEEIGREGSEFRAPLTGDTSTYINLGYDSIAGNIMTGSTYCAILGGNGNSVSGNFSIIGGGSQNSLSGGYSIVGGGSLNSIVSATYAFIGGGGLNTTRGDYSFIGGGSYNTVETNGDYGTISGGRLNVLDGDYSVISGGYNNTIMSSTSYPATGTTIAGGEGNTVMVNGHYNTYSAIGGGYDNTIDGSFSVIGGGFSNIAQYTSEQAYMTICGGYRNTVSEEFSVIGGGLRNSVGAGVGTHGNVSIIMGGCYNTVNSPYSFIGGGAYNQIEIDTTTNSSVSQLNAIVGGNNNSIGKDNAYNFIGGGSGNIMGDLIGSGYISDIDYSVICGGASNTLYPYGITGDPDYAFIGGGQLNTVYGEASYSAIVGGYSNLILSSNDESKYTFIGGGNNNLIGGDANCSSILGGGDNYIDGPLVEAQYSTIVGGYNNTIEGDRGGTHWTPRYSVAMGVNARTEGTASFIWNSDTSTEREGCDYSFVVNAMGAYFTDTTTSGYQGSWYKPSDLAERMTVGEKDIQEGDLVSIKYEGMLGKTTKVCDPNLIGVVSSDRTRLIMMEHADEDKENSRYIALVGVVYCNVSDENGPIAIGDPITSSSIPGVGMKADKACKIVGYAMDNFKEKRGEVLIFCNVSYYIPPDEYLDIKARIEKLKTKLKK